METPKSQQLIGRNDKAKINEARLGLVFVIVRFAVLSIVLTV